MFLCAPRWLYSYCLWFLACQRSFWTCTVCGTHLFCLWAALFWTTKCCVQVCRDQSLSETQSMSAERNLLSTITVFQGPGANVTDLCRNSLAKQNWYTLTESCLMRTKIKMFREIKMISSEPINTKITRNSSAVADKPRDAFVQMQ